MAHQEDVVQGLETVLLCESSNREGKHHVTAFRISERREGWLAVSVLQEVGTELFSRTDNVKNDIPI